MTADTFANDIPLDEAIRAHAGISMSPGSRGAYRQRDYAGTLERDYNELLGLADTPEKLAQLADEFDRYRAGYRSRYRVLLLAESRCMSILVTGPANFPTARNQKRNNTADNRRRELIEFRDRALKAIRRTLQPEKAPIMAGDADAADRLRAKIAEAEALHARMHATNKAHKAFLKDPASLDACELPEEVKGRIRRYVPRYSWEPHPIAPFEFTNNSANIRRMKERLAGIEAAQATPAKETTGTVARVEDCPADNRVRLFFAGKPAAEVRDRLKRNGFRWTPSLGCWQAYRNPNSLQVAPQIAGVAV